MPSVLASGRQQSGPRAAIHRLVAPEEEEVVVVGLVALEEVYYLLTPVLYPSQRSEVEEVEAVVIWEPDFPLATCAS